MPSPIFDVMCQLARNVDSNTTNSAVKTQLSNCIGNSYARAQRENKQKESQRKQKLSSKFTDRPRPQINRTDSTEMLPAEPLSPTAAFSGQPIPGTSQDTAVQVIDTVVATQTVDNPENTVVEFSVSDNL